MKRCGEVVSDRTIMNKVISTFSFNFDYIVIEIDESEDFSIMKVEGFKCSLESYEHNRLERTKERGTK